MLLMFAVVLATSVEFLQLAVQSSVVATCPAVVPRLGWNARVPKSRLNLTLPVDLVVIHHTYTPAACPNMSTCVRGMRAMQNYHMDTQGWDDIGYNFVIGGDLVFEGRGWLTVGAHAKQYNNRSIGISLIGDYRVKLPTKTILELTKRLIQCGVDYNYIQPDYQLFGHRELRNTECPGEALYKLIQTWDHWTPPPKPQ